VSRLAFSVSGARVEPYAAVPMLQLRMRVTETTGVAVYAIALKVQVRIHPQARRYSPDESERLLDLFGAPSRYGDTLRPLLWTQVSQMVLAFTGETEVDLAIPCSYDFEVAANKYLSALHEGQIPLDLQFSGNVFVEGPNGPIAELVPWNSEAQYRLPVAVWRDAVEAFFPNSAWLRVERQTFDELRSVRAARLLPTWDAVLLELLHGAAVSPGKREL
jgi:Family of unknown function (DUF6084)